MITLSSDVYLLLICDAGVVAPDGTADPVAPWLPADDEADSMSLILFLRFLMLKSHTVSYLRIL